MCNFVINSMVATPVSQCIHKLATSTNQDIWQIVVSVDPRSQPINQPLVCEQTTTDFDNSAMRYYIVRGQVIAFRGIGSK